MIQTFFRELGPLAFIALGAVCTGLLILFYAKPKSALFAYILVFPTDRLFLPVLGQNIRGDDVIIVLGGLALFLKFGFSRLVDQSPAIRMILVVILVSQLYRFGLLLGTGLDDRTNWNGILKNLHVILQAYVFVSVIRSLSDIDLVAKVYYWITLIFLISSIPELVSNPLVEEVDRYALKRTIGFQAEAGGFNPNAYGNIAGLAGLLGFYLWHYRGRQYAAIGLLFCLSMVSVFFFRTSMIMMIFVVVSCLLISMVTRPRLQVLILLIFVGILSAVSVDRLAGYFHTYTVNMNLADAGMRMSSARLGMEIFYDNWLIGVGTWRSDPLVLDMSLGEMGSIHNSYLITLAETGIIGFLLLLVLIGLIGHQLMRWSLRGRSGWFWLTFFVAFLALAFSSPILWSNKIPMQYFAFTLAALAAYTRETDGRLDAPDEEVQSIDRP